MKSSKKTYSNIMKSIVERALQNNANSTTCMIYYQPKAPATLKKFSKVDNDK